MRRTIMEIITIYLYLSGRFIGVLLFRCLVVATDGVTGVPRHSFRCRSIARIKWTVRPSVDLYVSVRFFFYLCKRWRGCGVKVQPCVVNLFAKWIEPLIALLECWYQSWLICRNYSFKLLLKQIEIKYRKYINYSS